MKITNSEAFILEAQLNNVIGELRESKVKNLSLNVMVKRNLTKIAEICNDFRKEIQEFKPAELAELEAIEVELTEDQQKQKDELLKDYNGEINKFLSNTLEYEPFTSGVTLEGISSVELSFDSSNIIDLLLNENV